MSKLQDAFFTLVIVLMVLGTAAINQAQAATTAAAVAARGSYKVKGVRYHPLKTAHNFKQTGKASWYGPGFHGKKTSNGERYNMHALTAAHKTLPLGTVVRVRNLANGKSVIVRINDRGPFHGNRIIDLSKAAAGRLDFIRTGMADVRVESLTGKTVLAENNDAPREVKTAAAPARLVKTSAAPAPNPYLTLAKSVPAHAQASPLYLGLQKFASAAEAQVFLRQTAEVLDAARLNYPLSVLPQDGAFQVRVGPFQRQEQMDELKQRLAAARRVI